MGSSRWRAASAAVERGWPVVPLRPYRKTPAVRDWDRHATLDPDLVRHWWSRRPYNVGISCRGAELLVVDLDLPDGPRAFAAAGDTGPTYTVRTASGGEHRYFRAPPGVDLRNTVGRLGPGVDTRAAGGYVVAAGSVLRTGAGFRGYEVVLDVPVAPAPAWLVAALTPAPRVFVPAQRAAPRRIEAYRAAVVDGEVDRVRSARPGTRAHTAFTAACRLGELVGAGWLDEGTAVAVLLAAASGHVGVAGWTEREALHHIGNGVERGRRTPRVLR
ncbi:bifunctional DNA primase/polymerase [Actinosynnema sp. NPDC020468]|uniref:bifunctional DNA primase/polymerase n=1 Tax=Actinosynnema sp. NPDC020468 TaxID=3154488 RepID=UPI0033D316E9